jgi:putative transposase
MSAIERLWRSVKYEEVYIKGYETLTDARADLTDYFQGHNTFRPHQALGCKTPSEAHFSAGMAGGLPPDGEAIFLKSASQWS